MNKLEWNFVEKGVTHFHDEVKVAEVLSLFLNQITNNLVVRDLMLIVAAPAKASDRIEADQRG